MSGIGGVLVGCGVQGRHWLDAMPSEIELVGFVDVQLDAARALAETARGPAPVVDDTLGPVLEATRPAIVFDCSVPSAHAAVTLEALEYGCHVLGEKPMASSMDEARRMVEASRASGLLYAVSQNYRFDRRARRAAAEAGRIAPLTEAHSDFFLGAHFDGFRTTMEHPLLLDMAVHTFDMARYLTGADPRAVTCHTWNPGGSWFAGDASGAAIFEMTDGVVYSYRGSWCAEGVDTAWQSSWRLVGSTGTVAWSGGDEIVAERVATTGGFRSELEALPPLPLDPGPDGLAAVLADFVRCVKTGAVPETVCWDNIKSLAMVHAAIKSASTRQRVEIDA